MISYSPLLFQFLKKKEKLLTWADMPEGIKPTQSQVADCCTPTEIHNFVKKLIKEQKK
jgi:hypothetical protein